MSTAPGKGMVVAGGSCPYLPNREMRLELFPETPGHRYLDHGFRRQGHLWYRPRCAGCQACIALRVDAARFTPRRDQRRCWRHNQDLQLSCSHRAHDRERQDLYAAYQQAVHGDPPGGDARPLHLEGKQTGGQLLARNPAGRLLAVSILDQVADGFSSVYCYYDPSERRRALGTFMLLAEIALCQQHRLPWLYMGYSVDGCHKMSYKRRFTPHQEYRHGRWQTPHDA